MANNGQAEEAIQFYYRALDLNPAYIRARYREPFPRSWWSRVLIQHNSCVVGLTLAYLVSIFGWVFLVPYEAVLLNLFYSDMRRRSHIFSMRWFCKIVMV